MTITVDIELCDYLSFYPAFKDRYIECLRGDE